VRERAKLILPCRETGPEIEIIWLVLADETTPVPQREIVVPLFDNIFDHRKTGKRIDMSKDWIAPTSRNGTKRYVQVKHISCFGAHQDGYTFIGIAGDLDPIQVRETPEEICALLGITNDGSHTTSDPALDIAHDAAPRSAPR
jgi:hypothetical protein